MEKVALVTGSSSGIGLETALMLSRSGFHTYASMRNPEKSNEIMEIANSEQLPLKVVQLDVNNEDSVKNAVNNVVQEKGRIDVLVNNAGYGLFGSLEDTSIEELKSQFETNFFGAIRTIQQVLPTMRSQHSGIIVNMSSVGGRMGLPILSGYQASKFALEGLSESILYELEPFGIKVILIEPGIIKTNIMNSSVPASRATQPKSPYLTIMQRMENYFRTNMEKVSIPPIEVAKVVLQAVTSENPDLRYTVGTDAAALIEARMKVPDKEFRSMIMKNFSIST